MDIGVQQPRLRYYQEEAVDSLFDYFATHGGTDPRGMPVRANPLVCMPTGTGKSLVIGEFCRRAMIQHPGTRIIMATHVKELIKQNAAKMQEIWPLAPLGIYSAGLAQRDTMQPVIFGGVQSMVKKFPMFSKRDLLIIDEAHLVSPTDDTNYQTFINELQWGDKDPSKLHIDHYLRLAIEQARNYNPWLKVIGLTATRYRLGLGCLTNGNIFTDIAYDICTIDGFNRLIAESYLCPLFAQPTATEFDLSNVGMSKGEYDQKQMEAAFDVESVTFAALKEFVEGGQHRASWLIFASGIKHAEHIAEMLNSAFGVPTVCIHSKRTQTENDKALEDWQLGRARCAVNINSLTTGVDHPACDYIGVMVGTMSTGKWVQLLGRCTRPYDPALLDMSIIRNRIIAAAFPYKKQYSIAKDFAGNTRRLGPINDPVIPKLKGQGPPGDAPIKQCKKCGTWAHISQTHCLLCGEEFKFQEKLSRHASNLELLRSTLPQIEVYKVDRVVMTPHEQKGTGKKSIKVAYFCGIRCFFEWKSVESTSNFQRRMSREWFRQRYHYNYTPANWDGDCPRTDAEVLALTHELRTPETINVWVNKELPEIKGYGF